MVYAVLLIGGATIYLSKGSGVMPDGEPALHTREIKDTNDEVIITYGYYLDSRGEEILHGKWVSWFTRTISQYDGPSIEKEYKHGKRDGPHREWNIERKIICVGQWKDNHREGAWTEYYRKGEIKRTANYHRDRIIGSELTFYQSGVKCRERRFDKNGDIAEFLEWYKDSSRSTYGKYVPSPDAKLLGPDPVKDGIWTYWDHQGNIEAEGEWKQGVPWEGVCGVTQKSNSFLSSTFAVIDSNAMVCVAAFMPLMQTHLRSVG